MEARFIDGDHIVDIARRIRNEHMQGASVDPPEQSLVGNGRPSRPAALDELLRDHGYLRANGGYIAPDALPWSISQN